MARKRLGEILIEAGLLDESRLRMALQEQQRWGGRLGRALLEMRMVREGDLVRALSQQLHIPIAPDLDTTTIPHATLDLVSLEVCQEHSLLPFRRDGKFLDVALVDPTNLSILDEIRIRTKLNVRPFIIGPYQLEKAIARHLQGAGSGDAATPSGAMRAAMSDPSVVARGNGARFIELSTGSAPPLTNLVEPAALAGAGRPPTSPAPAASLTPLTPLPPPAPAAGEAAVIETLQMRVTQLEALLARDEAVIRKLLGLLIDSRLLTREQILGCLHEG